MIDPQDTPAGGLKPLIRADDVLVEPLPAVFGAAFHIFERPPHLTLDEL